MPWRRLVVRRCRLPRRANQLSSDSRLGLSRRGEITKGLDMKRLLQPVGRVRSLSNSALTPEGMYEHRGVEVGT
jgi:hypothetical protein